MSSTNIGPPYRGACAFFLSPAPTTLFVGKMGRLDWGQAPEDFPVATKQGLSRVRKDYRARISVGFSDFVNALRHIPPGALFPYPEPGTGAHPSVSRL